MSDPVSVKTPDEARVGVIPHLRWWVCGLLFFATTINYIDRQVLGILKPVLEQELGWREAEYGWIVFSFQLAYALAMPLVGRMLDWLGTRAGYLIAVVVWSIAAMAHAAANSAMQFSVARFVLGFGEAGNFPAAIKTVADWFPQKERALATGIFNSGSNVGAILAPLAVPWIAMHLGWRAAFLITGAVGFLWVIAWLLLFRLPHEHPRLGRKELDLIQAGRESEQGQGRPIPYSRLLNTRQAWAFVAGKFLTDPVWWFYLFWLPGFLHSNFGLDLMHLGPPLIVIYLAADVGSIGGGWISGFLLGRGWHPNAARKTAMLICALCVVPVMFVRSAGTNLWLVVALVSLAAAAHQGWSANIFTIASDTFPRRAVGSVVGLGGMGGAVGGMLVAPVVGYWLDWSGRLYGPLFVVAGVMYLIALAVIHLLVPKLEPAKVE
jgi:MFS transporter, ACS family, hexuronate transporter